MSLIFSTEKVERSLASAVVYHAAINNEKAAAEARLNSLQPTLRDATQFLRSRRRELAAIRREILVRISEDQADGIQPRRAQSGDELPQYGGPQGMLVVNVEHATPSGGTSGGADSATAGGQSSTADAPPSYNTAAATPSRQHTRSASPAYTPRESVPSVPVSQSQYAPPPGPPPNSADSPSISRTTSISSTLSSPHSRGSNSRSSSRSPSRTASHFRTSSLTANPERLGRSSTPTSPTLSLPPVSNAARSRTPSPARSPVDLSQSLGGYAPPPGPPPVNDLPDLSTLSLANTPGNAPPSEEPRVEVGSRNPYRAALDSTKQT